MFFFLSSFFFFFFLRRNTSSSPSSKNWDDSTRDWLIENFSVCLGSDLDLDDFV